jgi:hypothetical protein
VHDLGAVHQGDRAPLPGLPWWPPPPRAPAPHRSRPGLSRRTVRGRSSQPALPGF